MSDSVTLPVRGASRYDVVVAGGGVAGVFAALGAARQGAKTALVEQHGFVGGQGTAGGVHTFCGETRMVNDAWREMLARLRALDAIATYRANADGRRFGIEELKFVLQEMLAEAAVTLYLHTQLLDVERDATGDPARLAALIIANKSGVQRLECAQAIDTTGDADLVARGGWAFHKGGPVLLPGERPSIDRAAGALQLPMSLYFTLVDTGAAVTPVLPAGCPTFADDEDVPMITIHDEGPLQVVKMKVIGHDATDGASLSAAEQAGRRQMMGVIHHLQTKGYRGKVYDTCRLAWVAPHIGIREGRRVDAEYVLTADDLLYGRQQPDAIGVASYHVDYHWPTVVQRAGTGVTTQCPPYHIPLRALRPRGAANLLVAGRCMAGDHMATSSFRVMGTCAQGGFGAGTAAALAAAGGGSLDQLDLTELRSALRAGGVRLDLAPYYSYLRRRRGLDEVAVPIDAGAAVTGLAVAALPSGDLVCVWTERPAGASNGRLQVRSAVRHKEQWGAAVAVGTAAGAGGGQGLPALSLDSDRLWAEGIEAQYRGEQAQVESDAPPVLVLQVGAAGWTSADGGGSWQRADAAAVSARDASAADSGAPTSPAIALQLTATDPRYDDARPALVRPVTEDGAVRLEVSFDGGATWEAKLSFAASGASAALAATADGVVLISLDADGIRLRRLAVDALLGDVPDPGAWHHSDRSIVEMVAAADLPAAAAR